MLPSRCRLASSKPSSREGTGPPSTAPLEVISRLPARVAADGNGPRADAGSKGLVWSRRRVVARRNRAINRR